MEWLNYHHLLYFWVVATREQYGVEPIGRVDAVSARFYAISVERRVKHPAVLAIVEAARRKVFG